MAKKRRPAKKRNPHKRRPHRAARRTNPAPYRRRRRAAHRSNPRHHATRRRRRRNPGMPTWIKGALIAGGLTLAVASTGVGTQFLVNSVVKPKTPVASAVTYGITGVFLALGFGAIPHGGIAAGIAAGLPFVTSAIMTMAQAPTSTSKPTGGLGGGTSEALMGRVVADNMGRVVADNMGGMVRMQPRRIGGLSQEDITHLFHHGRRLGMSDQQIGAVIALKAAA